LEIGYGGTEKRLETSLKENMHGAKMAWEGYLKRNPDFLN